MLIRTEAPVDILPVDRLLKKTFETDAEANLVMALRENGNRTLSLVACNDDGEVVGHLCLSPVTVDGQDNGWQGLAPLTIATEYQRQGLGLALMTEAKDILAELGYPVVVVLGDPNYYQRVGFTTAVDHGLTCRWDAPVDAFMVVELLPETLAGQQGRVEYSAEFSAL